MYQTNQSKRALLLGAASVLAIGIAAPAMAQDSSVETVVVTGSRIPQQGLYSASPTTVVGSQELKLTGEVNSAELIDQLPQQFGGETSGSDLNSSGETQVDLRGIGPSRTLVLVDGKRFAPSNIGGVVDLDSIPSAMIDHVEVVTGGASAVYGSDAMAGVVNIILKKDFEGLQVSGTYSQYTQHNDGETGDVSGILGFDSADGKGNVTMWMGYTHRAPVYSKNRAWSHAGLVSNGTVLTTAGGGSPSIPSGDFYLGSGPNAYKEYRAAPGGAFIVDQESLGAADPTAAVDFFNPNSFEEIVTMQQRYNLGGEGHYDLNSHLQVYARAMYSDNQNNNQIGPVTTSFKPFTITGDNAFLSPAQKTIIFGTAASTAADVGTIYLGKRLIEQGGRQSDYDFQNFLMLVGAKGDIGGGWSYDVSAQYGRSSAYEYYYRNYTSQGGLQNAISCGAPSVAAAGCAGWNIFDPDPSAADQYSPAVASEIGVTANLLTFVRESVITGSVNGDLGAWGVQSPWAKNPVAVAFGGEYREEAGSVQPDSTLKNNDALGLSGAVPPTHGSFNVREGFAEVKIPLVQGVPFFEDLEADGGYRYSSYSTAGAVSTYKYGLEWSPTDDFKLRGLIQRAVRAPNVSELFTADSIGLFTVTKDPCNGATGSVESLCLATGAKASQGNCPALQCQDQVGGNVNLKPEVADTKTVGIVFTPTFLDGFTATIDYYDINVAGEIGTFLGGPANVLSACYTPVGGFTSVAAQAASAACQAVHRAATGGFIGSGYVFAGNGNTAFLHPTGIDLETNYQTDLTTFGMDSSAGSISWNFNGTRQLKFEQQGSIFSPKFECAGTFGETCGAPDPHYRFNTRFSWESPNNDLLLSVRWRYIGGVTLDADTFTGTLTDPPDHEIAAQSYFDIAGIWTVREGVELSAGVNNVFNKAPPVVSEGLEANEDNTFPQTYDVAGAQVFASVQFKY